MAKKQRTSAFRTFLENMREVRRLLQIHGQLGGKGPGRRWGSEVLNKSAVVLLVACWEAYLEDVVAFAFDAGLAQCEKPLHFSKEVTRRVGSALREAKDERRIWDIAGDGWKVVLLEHRTKTIQNFHNPNSQSVDDFFLRALGMKSISRCWHWTGMSEQRAKEKLDKIVNVRGSIAHRVQHSTAIHLNKVKSYQGHIRRLVQHTDAEIRVRLKIN